MTPSASPASYKNELNPSGCLFDDMTRYYLAELRISGADVSYLIKRMTDPKTRGYTRYLGNNQYQVALAKGLEPHEIRITVAHELVHVRQLINGDIKKEEQSKYYLDRNYEREAFSLSMTLAASFYTEHKCEKKRSTSK